MNECMLRNKYRKYKQTKPKKIKEKKTIKVYSTNRFEHICKILHSNSTNTKNYVQKCHRKIIM